MAKGSALDQKLSFPRRREPILATLTTESETFEDMDPRLRGDDGAVYWV